MQYLLEYVIVGLFLIGIALLAAFYVLNFSKNTVITWRVIKIGPNTTITAYSNSRISTCKIITGQGKCTITQDKCICILDSSGVVEICAGDTCKFISVR